MKENLLYVPDREKWRAWLAKHHTTEKEVWLVYYKQHTGKPRVSYDDAVEEALCFGWIDSLVKTLDADRYIQKFTPRVNAGKWSQLNLERVKKLLREGRMTEAGRAKLPSDLETPTSVAPKRFSLDSPLPDLFASALHSNPDTAENFGKLAPSYQRKYVGWVMTAKKEETRRRRLAEAIRLLERNEKLGLK
jgi:uncharacterized protein YdeI (YjbR/CyaY-like superfamily)